MSKLKVAILEDNKILLKSLEEDLLQTNLVNVIVSANNSDEFFHKLNNNPVDALILDIDLGGDSMSGLDVAAKLKLPVLFVSGKTKEFFTGIEDLNINSSIPVDHITKPVTFDKLHKFLPKFIKEIEAINREKFIRLDFADSKQNKIAVDSIVFLETETGSSGAGNNKRIYFSDRKPETLYNVSLTKIHEIGLEPTKFIQIKSSHRVNVDKIVKYRNTHEIEVSVFSSNGKFETKLLPVSENYRKAVSSFKK